MPVWPIPSTELRPDVTLESWGVFEVPLHGLDQPWTRHLAGYSLEDNQGQVCSPVQSYDPLTALFVTRSGRVYRLQGRPGLDDDTEYVWERWKRIWEIPQERDVTQEVLAELQAAKAGVSRGLAD